MKTKREVKIESRKVKKAIIFAAFLPAAFVCFSTPRASTDPKTSDDPILFARFPQVSGFKELASNPYRSSAHEMLGVSSEAGLAQVYAYPVPFRPSENHSAITFVNLPENGVLRIYSIAGDQVRKIEFNTPVDGILSWDVSNTKGEQLGSDVYMYEVESGASRKTGKLVVIR